MNNEIVLVRKLPKLQRELRYIARDRAETMGISGAIEGAYYNEAMHLVELVFHELGHLVVLGKTKSVILHTRADIREGLALYSDAVCDEMEVDTSLITWVAGRKLGLWDKPDPIYHSMLGNLRDPDSIIKYQENIELFVSRYKPQNSEVVIELRSPHMPPMLYDRMVNQLIKLFVGRSKKAQRCVEELMREHEQDQARR